MALTLGALSEVQGTEQSREAATLQQVTQLGLPTDSSGQAARTKGILGTKQPELEENQQYYPSTVRVYFFVCNSLHLSHVKGSRNTHYSIVRSSHSVEAIF